MATTNDNLNNQLICWLGKKIASSLIQHKNNRSGFIEYDLNRLSKLIIDWFDIWFVVI